MRKKLLCRRFTNILVFRSGFIPMNITLFTFTLKKGEFESIYDLIIVNGILVELKHRKCRGVDAIPQHDRKKVEQFIREYYKGIVEKWTNYFVLNIPVKTTKITKKL